MSIEPTPPLSLPRAILLYALCIPPLIVIPAIIWAMHFPFISNSAGPEYELVELFGFIVTLAVVIVALYRLARFKPTRSEDLIPLLAFVLLGTYFAAHTTVFLPPSPDWRAYSLGADAILHGEDPYKVEGFIYPPFTVQALAALYRMIAFGASFVPPPEDPDFLWKGVFYVYQATQFFLVLGACGLSYIFARRCGIPKAHCAVLIVVLFVFNTPLLRTLHNHQVNLYLLDAMLIALLVTPQSALLSGIAIGIASHIKLYPLFLLAPLAILREWRVIIWTLVAIVAIVLIQTGWGMDVEVYRRYFEFIQNFPGGTAFRDNSIHSVVFNTTRALTGFREVDEPLASAVQIAYVTLAVAILVYFVVRIVTRERVAADLGRTSDLQDARRWSHMTDTMAALMLLSPMVWEHHYVLMVPVAIWAIATAGKEQPWAVGAGTFLMFCIPIFDVYPLSYHRIGGLAVVLWCTRPRRAGPTRSTPSTQSALPCPG